MREMRADMKANVVDLKPGVLDLIRFELRRPPEMRQDHKNPSTSILEVPGKARNGGGNEFCRRHEAATW